MLVRSIAIRILLAFSLSIGGPVCVCAATGLPTDSSAMNACIKGCDCCNPETAGHGDDTAPTSNPCNHGCADAELQAISPSPDVSPGNAGTVANLPACGLPLPNYADADAGAAMVKRSTVGQPANTLLRQHCALTI